MQEKIGCFEQIRLILKSSLTYLLVFISSLLAWGTHYLDNAQFGLLVEFFASVATVALVVFAFKALDSWKLVHSARRKERFINNVFKALSEFDSGLVACLVRLEGVKNIVINEVIVKKSSYDEVFNKVNNDFEIMANNLINTGENLAWLNILILSANVLKLHNTAVLNAEYTNMLNLQGELRNIINFLKNKNKDHEIPSILQDKINLLTSIDLKKYNADLLNSFITMLNDIGGKIE